MTPNIFVVSMLMSKVGEYGYKTVEMKSPIFRVVLNVLLLTQMDFPSFFFTFALFVFSVVLTSILISVMKCFGKWVQIGYSTFVIGEASYSLNSRLGSSILESSLCPRGRVGHPCSRL